MNNEYKILTGDCVERLKELPDNSIDSIVTDPPYGLSSQPDMTEVMRHWLNGDDYQHKGAGFMGKTWDSFVPGPSVWRECFRVLKPGGHMLAFFGSRTYDIGTLAIRLAGFEVRDQIMWVYGSGFPKSLNVSKAIDKAFGVATPESQQWDGWGTALKPAHEPIVMARKPISGTVASNVLEYGTGAINVDGCRVEGAPPSVPQPLLGAREQITYGFRTGHGRNGEMSSASGRFPANFIHDGSDEVVELFPDSKSTGGQASLGAFRNGAVYGKGRDERESCDPGYGDNGSAARFFYCAKASKRDRNEGCDKLPDQQWRHEGAAIPERANRPFIPSKNNHPTVKPTDLMRYLVRMVTPPNGTVLDPFTGSGSTGKACMLEGFNFIGCELSEEYAEIAKARIEHATSHENAPESNTSTLENFLENEL